MDRPKRIEVNCTTGVVSEIELTDEEIAQHEQDAVIAEMERAEREAVAQAQADAKLSAQAKLAALGLTGDEIAALTKQLDTFVSSLIPLFRDIDVATDQY